MTSQPAIAILTAPRPVPTFDATVGQIRWGGFSGPLHVFAEPGSQIGQQEGLIVHRNPQRRGMWRNWMHAARYLLRSTQEDRLLIFEDDVHFAHGAADAVARAFEQLPADNFGYISLFTPEHNTWTQPLEFGWSPVRAGEICWGSLGLGFTRVSLAAMLHSQTMNVHMRPNETDYVVGMAANELGLIVYQHVPSLCSHDSPTNSSVGNFTGATSRAVHFDPDFHPRLAELFELPRSR